MSALLRGNRATHGCVTRCHYCPTRHPGGLGPFAFGIGRGHTRREEGGIDDGGTARDDSASVEQPRRRSIFFAPLFTLAKLGQLGLHERRGEVWQQTIPIGSALYGDPMAAMMKVRGIRLRQQVSERLASVDIGKLHGSPPQGTIASALPAAATQACLPGPLEVS